MDQKRSYLSLSGLPSELNALGGWNGSKALVCCEKYTMKTNKWAGLPPLNIGRQLAASILLPSKRAFCFCGAQQLKLSLNSIERLDEGGVWMILPFNQHIPKTHHVAAVPFFDSILVFGGHEVQLTSRLSSTRMALFISTQQKTSAFL